MKTKELENIRKKEVDALLKEVTELKQNRDRVLADMSAGKEANLKKAKSLKRDIAQYLTIIREKEIKA